MERILIYYCSINYLLLLVIIFKFALKNYFFITKVRVMRLKVYILNNYDLVPAVYL
jgi:hypothetical protein